jgi:hypothetical protein
MSTQGAGKAKPALGEWTHKITTRPTLTMYEELGRTGVVVWARWWDGTAGKKGASQTKSTGMSIRFPPGHRREGEVSPAKEQEVLQLASRWHADLVAGNPPGTTHAASDGPDEDERASLTVAEGFRRYLDLSKGPYPDPSDPERQDVERAAEEAKRALGGGESAISSLVPMTAAQEIWRHVQRRFAEEQGGVSTAAPGRRERRNRYRKSLGPARRSDGATWAQRVVHHFFACTNWLRSRGHIPEGACLRPADWKKQFKTDWRKLTGRDLEEEREPPRFSLQEGGRLLDTVTDERVDPRLRINVYFGGDALRSGQVRRARRTDLDLSGCGEFGKGRLKVRGRGRKRGSTIDLDEVVRAQIDYEMTEGYLRECEKAFHKGEIADYALMPQGRFVQGATPVRDARKYLQPISRRTLLDYFHSLEELAGVPHVPGRAWYGLRRLWTDLGPQHVQTARAREILGGWARGSTVPQVVYESKQDELAIREASRARAAIREELRTGRLAELTELRAAVSVALTTCKDTEVLRHLLRVLRGGGQDPHELRDEPCDT